jgi:hypothetical protein
MAALHRLTVLLMRLARRCEKMPEDGERLQDLRYGMPSGTEANPEHQLLAILGLESEGWICLVASSGGSVQERLAEGYGSREGGVPGANTNLPDLQQALSAKVPCYYIHCG